jgi:hypothetical protein
MTTSLDKYIDLLMIIRQITWIDVNMMCFQNASDFYCKHHVNTNMGRLFLSGKNIADIQYKLNNIVDDHFKSSYHN